MGVGFEYKYDCDSTDRTERQTTTFHNEYREASFLAHAVEQQRAPLVRRCLRGVCVYSKANARVVGVVSLYARARGGVLRQESTWTSTSTAQNDGSRLKLQNGAHNF